MPKAQIGLVCSAFWLGWCTTLLWMPRYGDIWGRRIITIITSFVYFFFYLGIFLAPNVYIIGGCLFIMGVFNSWRTNVGLIYCMELMPKSKQSLTNTILNVLQGFLNLFATLWYMYVSIDWFGFVAIGLMISLYACVAVCFLPESPVYLLKRERYAELRVTL